MKKLKKKYFKKMFKKAFKKLKKIKNKSLPAYYYMVEKLFVSMVFFVRRIKEISILYVTSLFLFSNNTHAAVGASEVEKSKENASIIAAFFTTDMLLNIVFAVLVIVMTFVISKLITSRFVVFLESKYSGEESGREELVGVISRTVNIVVLCIGFSITLSIIGVDIGIFMGGIGFGLGFTMKTFLQNFVSGIMMVTQGEYHNGDVIEVDGTMGTIKRINALYTAIEKFDGVIHYVPNIKFMEENVSNYHSNAHRRTEVELLVDYSTDITKSKKIIMKVLESFPNILQAPEADVIVDKLDDSGIVLKIRFWIDSKSGDYFQTKSNVTETVNMAFRQYGIIIPFPQVTIGNREIKPVKI